MARISRVSKQFFYKPYYDYIPFSSASTSVSGSEKLVFNHDTLYTNSLPIKIDACKMAYAGDEQGKFHNLIDGINVYRHVIIQVTNKTNIDEIQEKLRSTEKYHILSQDKYDDDEKTFYTNVLSTIINYANAGDKLGKPIKMKTQICLLGAINDRLSLTGKMLLLIFKRLKPNMPYTIEQLLNYENIKIVIITDSDAIIFHQDCRWITTFGLIYSHQFILEDRETTNKRQDSEQDKIDRRLVGLDLKLSDSVTLYCVLYAKLRSDCKKSDLTIDYICLIVGRLLDRLPHTRDIIYKQNIEPFKSLESLGIIKLLDAPNRKFNRRVHVPEVILDDSLMNNLLSKIDKSGEYSESIFRCFLREGRDPKNIIELLVRGRHDCTWLLRYLLILLEIRAKIGKGDGKISKVDVLKHLKTLLEKEEYNKKLGSNYPETDNCIDRLSKFVPVIEYDEKNGIISFLPKVGSIIPIVKEILKPGNIGDMPACILSYATNCDEYLNKLTKDLF